MARGIGQGEGEGEGIVTGDTLGLGELIRLNKCRTLIYLKIASRDNLQPRLH